MGLDDLVNKGKGHFDQHRDKIDEALRTERAEQISDRVLGVGGDFIKKFTPDQHDAKVDDVRAKLDKHVGNE